MATEFHIRAHNPRGLDFDYLHTDPAKTIQTLKNIIAMGGQDITVNGFPVPAHMYELAAV